MPKPEVSAHCLCTTTAEPTCSDVPASSDEKTARLALPGHDWMVFGGNLKEKTFNIIIKKKKIKKKKKKKKKKKIIIHA